jgi:hypothetical protein
VTLHFRKTCCIIETRGESRALSTVLQHRKSVRRSHTRAGTTSTAPVGKNGGVGMGSVLDESANVMTLIVLSVKRFGRCPEKNGANNGGHRNRNR